MNSNCFSYIFSLLLFVNTLNVYAWNTYGHRLIAQIAYDNLTPKAKSLCNKYNHALDAEYPSISFINAASWLDYLKAKDIHDYDDLHYISIPFIDDGIKPPTPNVVTAIEDSTKVLHNTNSSDFEKGMALRIILHTVGDVHQPMHTVSLKNKHYPLGDKGGNLVVLKKNHIANNLHAYWDRGAGYLIGKSSLYKVKKKARSLQQKFPCYEVVDDTTPAQWAKESHLIAVNQAYTKINKQYERKAIEISKIQIIKAGCRLAHLLNTYL